MADWRAHCLQNCARMKDTAIAAFKRALENFKPLDADAALELEELGRRLAPV